MKSIFILLFFGSSWYSFSQKVSHKVGTNPTIIAPSAALEVESTTKGLLPPRMTFAQRNAIVSPATGLIVYCTNCGSNGELQFFNGTTWTNSIGGTAASSCGAPTNTGGFLVFKCHNLGADESADPFTPSWRLNGAYFQWGKKPVDTNSDGYRTKPHNSTEGFAAAPTGPGALEANDGAIASWSTTAAPNGAWNINEASPLKTANDPCPNGFRVPTRNEWVSIYNTTPTNTQINWSNVGSFINSPTSYTSGKNVSTTLFLPATGFRLFDGSVYNRGISGYYWSSTEYGTASAYSFMFNGVNLVDPLNSNDRKYSFSVRCVKQ